MFKFFTLLFVVAGFFPAMQTHAQTGDLFFGQEHSYTVVFRGNGEAVAYGKISFTNTGDKAVDTFGLQIPNAKVGEFSVMQKTTKTVQQNPCYDYYEVVNGKPCPVDNFSYPSTYYNNGKMPSTAVGYEKLTFTSSGNRYNIKLIQPIDSNTKGEIIFAYTTQGYVTKSLGVYKFSFETPKVDSRIKNISVSVDVDSELVLKGKRSNVNYSTKAVSSGLMNGFADSSGARVSSPEFDQSVNLIGTNGPVTKRAQNLSPNESLSVNGEYSDSKWALTWFSLLWKFLLGLAIILLIIWFIRWSYLRSAKMAALSNPAVPNAAGTAPLHTEENTFYLVHPMYTGIGVLSAIFVTGIIFVTQIVLRANVFFSSYDSGLGILGLILFVGLLIIAALVLPPVVTGVKFGWRSGVSVFVNTMLAFMVIFAVYIILRITGIWPTRPSIYQDAVTQYQYDGPK